MFFRGHPLSGFCGWAAGDHGPGRWAYRRIPLRVHGLQYLGRGLHGVAPGTRHADHTDSAALLIVPAYPHVCVFGNNGKPCWSRRCRRGMVGLGRGERTKKRKRSRTPLERSKTKNSSERCDFCANLENHVFLYFIFFLLALATPPSPPPFPLVSGSLRKMCAYFYSLFVLPGLGTMFFFCVLG